MRTLLLLVGLVLLIGAAASFAASTDPPLAQQLATAKAQLAKSKAANRPLRTQRDAARDERDAANLVIEDLQDENTRLRNRLANQPDPLDVILARDPAGVFAAVGALWRDFPTLQGSLCGFDKGSTQSDGVLTPDSYTFQRWNVS